MVGGVGGCCKILVDVLGNGVEVLGFIHGWKDIVVFVGFIDFKGWYVGFDVIFFVGVRFVGYFDGKGVVGVIGCIGV